MTKSTQKSLPIALPFGSSVLLGVIGALINSPLKRLRQMSACFRSPLRCSTGRRGKGRGWYYLKFFFRKSTARGAPPLCDFHTTEYRSRVRIKARICLSRFSGELYAPRTWRETQGTPQEWWGGARALVTFARKSNTAKGAGTPIKITACSDTRRRT